VSDDDALGVGPTEPVVDERDPRLLAAHVGVRHVLHRRFVLSGFVDRVAEPFVEVAIACGGTAASRKDNHLGDDGGGHASRLVCRAGGVCARARVCVCPLGEGKERNTSHPFLLTRHPPKTFEAFCSKEDNE
jgi:hypothetical protein